jgi:XTP/dITP diphosphohydrolase
VDKLRAVLGSANDHKRRELERVLPGWEIELLGVESFPDEVGRSFYENALAKARFARALAPNDVWALGEDSGIEVVALGGRPGVETARWAGGREVERMLDALAGVVDRRARYVCELVGISPDGRELRGTGSLEGQIASESHGVQGFGFDPVFVPDGETQTVAELGDVWKTGSSHRARAARALRAAHDRLIETPRGDSP